MQTIGKKLSLKGNYFIEKLAMGLTCRSCFADHFCYSKFLSISGRYYGHNCANRDTSMKFGIKVD